MSAALSDFSWWTWGGGAVTSAIATRDTVDYLDEALAICKRLKVVWWKALPRVDPATREAYTVYLVYRRFGNRVELVATRTTPQRLVAYLRKQLPAESAP